MSLTFKKLTIKNFMSVGNVEQTILFENSSLFLVIGDNVDQGSDGNRNGTGKTTIANALSYVLYGKPVSSIRPNNLINNKNEKDMLVTLSFSKNGKDYYIERGRKPNKLDFYINDSNISLSQGENKETQEHINEVLNISHSLFNIIILLTSSNLPFLSLRAGDQKLIIEELLGITKLSEKANILKEEIRETKDKIKENKFNIKALESANKRIEQNINAYKIKSKKWESEKKTKIEKFLKIIKKLEELDINKEFELHSEKNKILKENEETTKLLKLLDTKQKEKNKLESSINKIKEATEKIKSEECPTCFQQINKDTHKKLFNEYSIALNDLQKSFETICKEIALLEQQTKNKKIKPIPETFYTNIDHAYKHKSELRAIKQLLETEKKSKNIYEENITQLKEKGLQKIDTKKLDELTVKLSHQEFLYKLLSNKDSFIRKKILNLSLASLNEKLKKYLIQMQVPHSITFNDDLSITITQYGRLLDFDNLSRGEKTRLILSLSWAFRDIYEQLNGSINLMFIDELLDNGLDTPGVEKALQIIKSMVRDRNKCIKLISHREELFGRVDKILKVKKENSFTTFIY